MSKHIAEEETNLEHKTGAKKGAKTIATIVVAGGLIVGGITGTIKIVNNLESTKVRNLVNEYTSYDCLTLPKKVTINQAYDLNYCDGKTLYNAITKSGVKYCEVLDEYYTEDGREIAVLTITGTCTESIPAECVEINGAKVYMAPTGYELNGENAYRTINQSYTQIIEKQDDYSNIVVNGLDNVNIEVKEVQSRPFSDIISETLIVDVPDGATLNSNKECTASFRLVPKE